MAKGDKKRQWIHETNFVTATPAAPKTNIVMLADPRDSAVSFGARLLRVLVSVSIDGTNLQAQGTQRWVGFGLCRTIPEQPSNGAGALGPLDPSQADRSWLYRQVYRLPVTTLTAVNGLIDLNNEPYQLDWPIRGGRGSNLEKDVEFRWCIEAQIFGGAVNVCWKAQELWETDD